MCTRQALHHLSYIPSPFLLFSESYYVIQVSLKLMVLLPWPLKHWDDRHVPLQLAPSLYCEAGAVLVLNLAKESYGYGDCKHHCLVCALEGQGNATYWKHWICIDLK